MTTTPSAKIIADSVSPNGDRLTTMEVTFHRFVLAEMNTHRLFSRNSASSRAIPVGKILDRVQNDPAWPVEWGSEKRGMQAGLAIADDRLSEVELAWSLARDEAVIAAQTLAGLGVHKGLTNRLLEPFGWHTAIISSTSWDNFFEQRVSPLAQPEIREAAEAMFDAYESNEPVNLVDGQWHLPYVEDEDWDAADALADEGAVEELLVAVSAARCARVSYLTHDGKRDLSADLGLYEKLVTADPWHGSPLEHVATPWAENGRRITEEFEGIDGTPRVISRRGPQFGNFTGWRQLRLEIEASLGMSPLN